MVSFAKDASNKLVTISRKGGLSIAQTWIRDLENKKFVDCILSTEDGSMEAHRAPLAAASGLLNVRSPTHSNHQNTNFMIFPGLVPKG